MKIGRMGLWSLAVVLGGLVAACGDDGNGNGGPNDAAMADANGGQDSGTNGTDAGDTDGGASGTKTYAFTSAFSDDSSVNYSGQTARNVLLDELKNRAASITEDIDNGDFSPAEQGDVLAELNLFYEMDNAGGKEIGLELGKPTLQETYDDIATGKNLVGKTAGNDDVTDHKDWDGGDFTGWSGASSPQALITSWFQMLADNAVARAGGEYRFGVDGDGNELSGEENRLPAHITTGGLDLQQLIEKFTRTAVTYSQGTDDYLDDDVDGKGLKTSNTEQDEGAPYTPLEHQWDEGFGYFGAARDYLTYTDQEIAQEVYRDSDGDGAIDLKSEYNFGHSVNAADRDLGSADSAMTNFTKDAFDALQAGRALINEAAPEALSDDQMTQLQEYRDQAVLAWEKAIAASCVHYINVTLQIMATFGTEDYEFNEHATDWSELKGFALGLQFNPRKQLSDSQFEMLHQHIGDEPVLPSASDSEISAYQQALLDARSILQSAYGFADANMGDDNGMGGW